MNRLKNTLLDSIKPIHKRLRAQKVSLFFQLVGGGTGGTLLDVGGGPGITGEFLPVYEKFRQPIVVNLEPPKQEPFNGHIYLVRADGCDLPFPDASFDWVFSNAVIEHVGGWERQKAFASEIRRVVKKGYFVATPNRYFPVEPHTLLPLYQFMSRNLQRRAVHFSPGYVRAYEEIHLLSPRQLQQLFPEATVRVMGFPLWGNNLVALFRVGAPSL